MSAGIQTFLTDKKTGRVYINPMKRHVRSFWLTTDPGTVVVAGLAASPPTLMSIDTQGHFEMVELMAISDAPFLIEIFDPATQKFWHNRAIHSATILGDALRTFILPESYFFNVEDAPRALRLNFTNLSPDQNSIRVVAHGRRIYHRESPPDVQRAFRNYYRRKERTNIYFLTTDAVPAVVPVAAGTTQVNFTLRNTDEADLEIFKLTAAFDFPFEFRIRETSTNKTLSNGFVRVEQGFGTAFFPKIFPESYLLERNFELTLEVRNLAVQVAVNNIFFTFTGRRIYYAQ